MLLARALRSLDLMLSDYRPGAKSRHWMAHFTRDMAAALRDERELRRFRSPGSPLFTDMEDAARWFCTAEAFDRFRRELDVRWIVDYSETDVGSPTVHRIGGVAVNHHELILCQHLAAIAAVAADPRLIVEIGGGFGGLARKLKRRFPGTHIVLFDLPEALTLQAWYLSQLDPDARFYLFEDFARGVPFEPNNYDFSLLPGWLASAVTLSGVDLFINTRSIMEMTKATIADYFAVIQRCLRTGGSFYNVNRYSKSTVGEPIRIRDYPYDERWRVTVSRPSPLQPHIHDLIAERTSVAGPEIGAALAALPADVPISTRGRLSIRRRLELLPLAVLAECGGERRARRCRFKLSAFKLPRIERGTGNCWPCPRRRL